MFMGFMLETIKASLIDTISVSDGTMYKAAIRWKQIEKFLEIHPYIMNADLCVLCGVSASTANRILVKFSVDEKIVKNHISEYWTYHLKR